MCLVIHAKMHHSAVIIVVWDLFIFQTLPLKCSYPCRYRPLWTQSPGLCPWMWRCWGLPANGSWSHFVFPDVLFHLTLCLHGTFMLEQNSHNFLPLQLEKYPVMCTCHTNLLICSLGGICPIHVLNGIMAGKKWREMQGSQWCRKEGRRQQAHIKAASGIVSPQKQAKDHIFLYILQLCLKKK